MQLISFKIDESLRAKNICRILHCKVNLLVPTCTYSYVRQTKKRNFPVLTRCIPFIFCNSRKFDKQYVEPVNLVHAEMQYFTDLSPPASSLVLVRGVM